MKIGAHIHYFNYEMRRRRRERGWTQKGLADETGINVCVIGMIERLEYVPSLLNTLNHKLMLIAHALDCDFHTLFPDEYLEALVHKRLPRKSSFLWVYDVSLDVLPEATMGLALPGPDVTVLDEMMTEVVQEVLSTLPERQEAILRARFGFDNGEPKTVYEIARQFGISHDKVRRLESQALLHCRHPLRAERLKDYLYARN